MKHFLRRPNGLIFALALSLVAFGALNADAQKVPIDFNDFHGHDGTVKYLKAVAEAYPEITELMVIGKSNLHQREIYVLAISRMDNGTNIDAHVELRNMRKENVQNVPKAKSHMGKPGHWISGVHHGNEFTGTEVCLYTIGKLVNGYGNDDEITRLIDQKVFYICPMVNPDGIYSSVEGDTSQRANSELRDDDGDGEVNEDGADDLNGDGHITNFRYKDPEGGYVIDDVEPRHMVRLGRGVETDKERYSVVTEDKDNDGDGRRGEDGESGIDLNRNYPEGWWREDNMPGGRGPYPTSAPETHAVAEFFSNYRNILIAQNYHTSGGFTYRPLDSGPEATMNPKDIAVYDRIMGKKFLEIIGDEVPEAWKATGSLDKFKAELEAAGADKFDVARGYLNPRGWRPSYNEITKRGDGYGLCIDWQYMQRGIYAICTELWNSRKDMKGIPEFVGEDAALERERALLKYQDEEFGGKFFIDWKPYTHPELGEGEIGGWIPRYRGSNAFPGPTLIGVCDKHYRFEIFRAGLLPEVEIAKAEAKVLYTVDDTAKATISEDSDQVTISKGESKGGSKIVEVTALVENTGALATNTANSQGMPNNRADAVWLVADRDKVTFLEGGVFQSIGTLAGTMPIPGYEAPPNEDGSQQSGDDVQQGRRGQRGQRQQQTDQTQMQRGQRQRDQRQRQMGQSQGQRDQGAQPQQLKPNQREVKWLIAVDGDTTLKVIVTSQKGGTKVQELEIN